MTLLGTHDFNSDGWITALIGAGWTRSGQGRGVEKSSGGYTLRLGDRWTAFTSHPNLTNATLNYVATFGVTGAAAADLQVAALYNYAAQTVHVYSGGAVAFVHESDGGNAVGWHLFEPIPNSQDVAALAYYYSNSTQGRYPATLGFVIGGGNSVAFYPAWGARGGAVCGARGVSGLKTTGVAALAPYGSLVDTDTVLLERPQLYGADTMERLHEMQNALAAPGTQGFRYESRSYNAHGLALS